MNFFTEGIFLGRADEEGRRKMEDRLKEKHPDIVENIIGHSILSREIKAFFVGEGRKYIAVFAAHHALENITANIAYLLCDYLLTKSRNGKINGVDCKLMLSKYCFIIVPCVNPDGVELRYNGADNSLLRERQLRLSGGDFSLWQANARGVDLNHNYDYRFNEYKRIEQERDILAGPTLYSGEYPESEPETRAVANLVRTLAPRAVVSLHSQGEEIYFFPHTTRTKRIAGRMAKMCAYSLSVPSGTASYGGLSDYSGSLGIPSFTFELGKGKNPLPESLIPEVYVRVRNAVALLPTIL